MRIILPARRFGEKIKKKMWKRFSREDCGIMEQLYRSLYEMRELSIRNMIQTIFIPTQFVSFEIVAKEKVGDFLCRCTQGISKYR